MEGRKVFVGFRLSQTERRALDRLVALERRRASEVLRDLVRQEARKRGVWPVQVQQPEEAQR